MATIRVEKNKDNPYVTLNRTALDDESLSFKAKGIFSYLMSKPDDWKCQVNDLKKQSKDGRDSIYAGLKELREHGYMIKRPVKDSNNVIIGWEEILYEVPQEEVKEIYKEQKIKSDEAAIKRAATIAAKNSEYPLPENQDMEKSNKISTSGFSGNGESVYGKPGSIINTDIQNTDIPTNEISCSSEDEFKQLLNLYTEYYGKITASRVNLLNDYFNRTNFKFMKAVLCYVIDQKARTHTYFNKTMNALIEKGISTIEEFETSLKEYSVKESNVKKVKSKKTKEMRFNDFNQREYNYDILEKKLLGWKDDEIAEALNITLEELNILSKGIEA